MKVQTNTQERNGTEHRNGKQGMGNTTSGTRLCHQVSDTHIMSASVLHVCLVSCPLSVSVHPQELLRQKKYVYMWCLCVCVVSHKLIYHRITTTVHRKNGGGARVFLLFETASFFWKLMWHVRAVSSGDRDVDLRRR
jgi:hypothetical protein